MKAADTLPITDRDEPTEGWLQQEAADAGPRRPNRNFDKPDFDKPAYK